MIENWTRFSKVWCSKPGGVQLLIEGVILSLACPRVARDNYVDVLDENGAVRLTMNLIG